MKYCIVLAIISIFISCRQKSEREEDVAKSDVALIQKNLTALIGKDYIIDDQHSYLGFKIKYFGFSPVRGRFDEFSGTVFYDENKIENLSVTILIEAKSINTGEERRDNDLTSEDTWFDVAQYPQIIFQSSGVLTKPDGGFDLIGALTIKGITKNDTIQFDAPTAISRDWAKNEQVDFSGRVIINRQDFEVYGGDFWSSVMENGLTQLSDEVEIEIDIHCRRPDYSARYEDADSSSVNKIILNEIKEAGMDQGMQQIEQLFKEGRITSGTLSSVGYTLVEWEMYSQAKTIFKKRIELFPTATSSYDQLGILSLLENKKEEAIENFNKAYALDSVDTRAIEYLRIVDFIE